MWCNVLGIISLYNISLHEKTLLNRILYIVEAGLKKSNKKKKEKKKKNQFVLDSFWQMLHQLIKQERTNYVNFFVVIPNKINRMNNPIVYTKANCCCRLETPKLTVPFK